LSFGYEKDLTEMNSRYSPPQTKKVRRIDLIEMLNEVALAARKHMDVQQTLEEALDIVVRRLEMEAGAIFLWEDGKLALRVRRGISEEHAQEVDRRRARRLGEDPTHQAARSENVFFVADMAQDPRFEGMWKIRQNRSYLQIPLIASRETKGVMGLVTKAGEPLSGQEADLLGAVGHQVGLIIENVDLMDEAVRCENEAKMLLVLGTQISASLELDEVLEAIAESAKGLLGMEHGIAALIDESGKQMNIRTVAGPLREKLRGKKIFLREQLHDDMEKLGEMILFEAGIPKTTGVWDMEEILSLGITSLLAIPLLRGERALGLLAVMEDEPHSFSERDVRLLQQLAQSVVIAIENAKLYQQVRSMTAIEERRWLAREMHDDLAQGLGLINIQATVTDDMLSNGKIDQARESLKRVKEIANRSYTDVREAIFSLRTIVSPDTQFLSTLQDYLSDYQRHYGLETSLDAEDESAVQFSYEVGAQVSYIIKEAITNARKHGGAKRVEVSIVREDCGSVITVKDDGVGFNPLTISREDAQHMGLQIMRERAWSVGGELEVHSGKGEGTNVTLCVPVDPAE
jgi:signal transduction histidine kinase